MRAALASAVPTPCKTPLRGAAKLEPAKPLIDAMLREDVTAPRTQQHTARRVLARLSAGFIPLIGRFSKR